MNEKITLIENYFELKQELEKVKIENNLLKQQQQEIKQKLSQIQFYLDNQKPSTLNKVINTYTSLHNHIKIITIILMFLASHNPILVLNLWKLSTHLLKK